MQQFLESTIGSYALKKSRVTLEEPSDDLADSMETKTDNLVADNQPACDSHATWKEWKGSSKCD